jgi:hypothetical protein
MAEIPKGFCQCGCGELAPIATYTAKKRGYLKGTRNRFISGHNLCKRELSPAWKGGRKKHGDYMEILMPEHPRSGKNGYVLEHILIAEKALGKPLPQKAQIHHYTPDQLVICQNQAYHRLLHQRQRAFNSCGHANWRKCPYCKHYDDPEKLNFIGRHAHHLQCKNEYQRNHREKHNG